MSKNERNKYILLLQVDVSPTMDGERMVSNLLPSWQLPQTMLCRGDTNITKNKFWIPLSVNIFLQVTSGGDEGYICVDYSLAYSIEPN